MNAPEASDDLAVIQRVLNGDCAAFGELVRRHQNRLFAAMMIMLGNRQDAEDVAQEALVLSFRKLSTFENRSSFYTWLHRIAFRLALSHRRKTARRQTQPNTSLEVHAEPLDYREDSAESRTDRNEQQMQLRLALARMDEERRHIIVLRDMQGLDYSEIATELEIPIGTVRSRLHRARLELKEILEASQFSS